MLSQRPLCSIFHCGEALRLAGHVTKIRNSVLLILAAWNEGVGDLLNWYPEWSSKERSVFNACACVRLDFSHLNTLLLLHCVFPRTVFLHYLASVDSAIARCGDMGKMVFFKSLPFLVNKRIIGTVEDFEDHWSQWLNVYLFDIFLRNLWHKLFACFDDKEITVSQDPFTNNCSCVCGSVYIIY